MKKTSNHLIVYFDILGYKNIVQSKRMIQGREVNEGEIINAIDNIVKPVFSTASNALGARNAKVYCFSDNFVIAVKITEDMQMLKCLESLIFIMQLIQKKLILEFGFFIRGSIVKGELYASKNFIYGDGLIKAYMVENELAYYPRTIVEYSLVKEVINIAKSCIAETENFTPQEEVTENNIFHCVRYWIFHDKDERQTHLENYDYKSIRFRKDFDNEYFVDYLAELYNSVGESGIEKVINLYPTDEELNIMTGFNLSLWGFCQAVFSAMKNYCEMQNVLTKYLWCCSYINAFCFENNIQQPFTAESIQYDTNINLKNIKYRDLLGCLKVY